MAFNTGNALGSTDPRDFSDNSENLDRAVNNTASATWTDRFGSTRTSLAGQIGYIGTGAGGAIEDYAAGQELTTFSTIIRYSGEFYRPAAGATLPYTTTATTPDVDANLVSVGDATLRQDLTNNASLSGSDLVAHAGTPDTVTEALDKRTIFVDTVTDLEALTPVSANQEAIVSGTPFKYDGSDWNLSAGFVYVESFGASPSLADNTTAYDALIAYVPDGTRVIWGDPNGKYIGNFWSQTKSLKCDLNGANLVNFVDDEPLCAIGTLSATEYAVTESTLNYGDTSFTVVGASGLFSAGDIGYLWDSAVRPTGGDVNFESVKIKSVSGDTVTVEGFLASFKGAGAIKFHHDDNQLKSPEIKNGTLSPNNTHNFIVSGFFNCEKSSAENIDANNFVGNAVSARYCYDLNIKNIRPVNPRLTGSGQGYGVGLIAVSVFSVENIKGIGCRHAYDQDSAYFGTVKIVKDPDAQSVPADLAHNGFAGHINFEDLEATTDTYPIYFADQGYGGSPAALADNHPFREVSAKNIKVKVPAAKSVNDFGVYSVYLANNVKNVSVKDVSVQFLNADAVSSGSSSIGFRINGSVEGYCTAENFYWNKIGRKVFLSDNGTSDGFGNVKLRNFSTGSLRYAVFAAGGWSLDIDGLFYDTLPMDTIIQMFASGSETPSALSVGPNISYEGVVQIASSTADNMFGEFYPQASASSSSVTVGAGDAISAEDLQWRAKTLQLLTGVGTGTITLGADPLPNPLCRGAECNIYIPAGRNSADLPAGTYNAAMTLGPEKLHKLIAKNGLWELYPYA